MVNKVILEDAPVTYCFEKQSTFFGIALAIPGILKWGDIPLAAALSDAEQSWIAPRKLDGTEIEFEQNKIEYIKQRLKRS